jgi:glucose-1-phosphate thymidylyltransferase
VSGYAKELFPLLFEGGPRDREVEPRPIGELALRSIRAAGAAQCIVVVSYDKAEVLRVLGHGVGLEMSLAYVVQPKPEGLPHAVRTARPWLGEADVVFAMPDTILLPTTALADVHSERVRTQADVMLGVFPVDEPERLGPVEMDREGKVLHVYDKPSDRRWMNSWAIASWSHRFTDFCSEWDEKEAQTGGGERVLGHAFEAARREGLGVRGMRFERGVFLDIGTPQGLRAALAVLAERGVLEPAQALTAKRPGSPRRRLRAVKP